MFDFLRAHQLNIMLVLCGLCFCFAFMLFITKFLESRRKKILIFMELTAAFLLFFDRMAYIYSGVMTLAGYIMVRVSNFFVFFLTAGILFIFNQYVIDVLVNDVKVKVVPKRLAFVSVATLVEMLLVIVSQITGLFYYFDAVNRYHRGPGFLICYIIPILGPLVEFTVIHKYRDGLSRWIYASLVTYMFAPIIMAIIQLKAYGLSLVNMTMTIVSVCLYVFTYLDINESLMNAHSDEMMILEEEKKSAKRLFDQTATAFMAAVEQRDKYSVGHAERVARLSKRIAIMLGKSEDECDAIYYAALLHNVGLVSIPDELFDRNETLSDEERKIIEQVPVHSSEILSGIEEHPYLKEAALYSHERYDGSGYPLHLKGETIPEVARIVGVADEYDAMTSRRSYRGALPLQTIREEFIKQAGIKYDPKIAALMIRILDYENNTVRKDSPRVIEKELRCKGYRDSVSAGIPIQQEITKINFNINSDEEGGYLFSEPAIILFDSFDGFVHDNKKAIEAYHYIEFGEIWFNGQAISTSARNLQVQSIDSATTDELKTGYEILVAKYEDHIKIEMLSPKGKVETIVALPDRSKAVYIGLTGENCRIYDIRVSLIGEKVKESDIPKIVNAETYTNRMESDVPNIQVDQYRSASTTGILLEDKLRLDFHTMSLPSSNLVWHCPYIVLYYSDDKRPYGENYREYAMIKINGEVSEDEGIVENKFAMRKNENFKGWDDWKIRNKEGMECSVEFVKKGNIIVTRTENLGIAIDNTTIIYDGTKEIYVTLSGDQVAITDIRIS